MQYPAVNWHEGLFLQPHHFQAWDRHWSERVSTGEQWQSPFGYGVLSISINESALAAGFLQIDSLRCKTPGGALIDFGTGHQSERRDLRPALDVQSSQSRPASPNNGRSGTQSLVGIDVYIGVPRLKLGNKNVDEVQHINGARFRAHWLDLPDEVDAASVRPVELRQLNAKILLGTDDLAGFDVLRIARVQRSTRDTAIVQLDPNYIPPVLECSAWTSLRSEVLSALYDLMQQYSEQFSQQIFDHGGALHANSPIDVQRLLVLQAVNPAASVLGVLANSRGIHPLTAYVELAKLAGSLDLISSDRVAKPTAAYDHENLGGIFFELKHRIVRSIAAIQSSPYKQYMFLGNDRGMQVAIESSQFLINRRWFIGIMKGNLASDTLHELLAPGNMDWKLGSLSQVDRLFAQRSPGIELRSTQNMPSSLPRGEEWVYYEVLGLDQPAWKDVKSTGTLAMRISDEIIVQRDSLVGQKTLLVSFERKTIPLQFALFGVP